MFSQVSVVARKILLYCGASKVYSQSVIETFCFRSVDENLGQIKSAKGFSLSVQPVLALGASYGSPPFHMQIEEKPSTNGGRLSALTASIHV